MIQSLDLEKSPNEQKKSILHRNKYLAVLNDWATKSTCFDGIPSIGRSEEWHLKLIWMILFLVALAYCGYSLTTNLTDYFDYDVSTQITIQRQSSIEFPTVREKKTIL